MLYGEGTAAERITKSREVTSFEITLNSECIMFASHIPHFTAAGHAGTAHRFIPWGTGRAIPKGTVVVKDVARGVTYSQPVLLTRLQG